MSATIEVEHVAEERQATHVILPIEAYRSAFSLLQDLPYRHVGGTMSALNASTRLVREVPTGPRPVNRDPEDTERWQGETLQEGEKS